MASKGNITEFDGSVISQLNHYVYRLVDPRNGQTFYVGEGCGNRVFVHANAVDPSFYEKYGSEQDERTEDDDDPAKIKVIKKIKQSGLDVVHIIQRWGMDKKTAFEVEAAFIDFFGLPSLTNRVKGHDAGRGMISAYELNSRLTAEPFELNPDTPHFVLIKIHGAWNEGDIYRSVRQWWNINIARANRCQYVLAVINGIVMGVYQLSGRGWQKPEGSKKAFFDGEPAPEDIQDLFVNKKLPEKFRGRNPVRYFD